MDAGIVMSPNTTPATWIATWRRATHVGEGVQGCSRRNANGWRADIKVTYPKKRKAVTFALDWDERYETALCPRCRDHMQKHYHGELCGRCGAIFTINRPWSLPELKIHHGVAHGTSSPVLEKRLTRSEST